VGGALHEQVRWLTWGSWSGDQRSECTGAMPNSVDASGSGSLYLWGGRCFMPAGSCNSREKSNGKLETDQPTNHSPGNVAHRRKLS
jgi:hypothetical protein